MRNNLIVFCNIEDGFEDIVANPNEKDIKKFINRLEQKRIENGCNKVTICLITQNEDGSYLKKYYDHFEKVIDNYRITMGMQYFKYGGIIDGNIKFFGEENDLFEFINAAASSFAYSVCEPITQIIFIGSHKNNNSIKEYYKNNDLQKNKDANYEYCSVNVDEKTDISFKEVINRLEKSIKYNTYKDNSRKENILLFFCDIDGTIDKIDKNSIKELKEVLEAKKVAFGADKIILNLISNCTNSEYLKSYANILSEYISSDTIVIGEHFYKDGLLIENNIFDKKDPTTSLNIPIGEFKADKIMYLINKFSKKYNIKHICYADDVFDNECYMLLTSLLNEATFDIEFYSSVFTDNMFSQNNIISFTGNIWGLIESIRKNTYNFTDKDKIKLNTSYKIGEKPVSNNN